MARKKKVIEPVVEEVEDVVLEEPVVEETQEEIVEPEVEENQEEIVEPVVEEATLAEQIATKPLIIKEPVEDKDAVIKRIKDNATVFSKEYFESRKKAGCDYESYGDWQKNYGKLLNAMFGLKDKAVIDIGGAYGALAQACLESGAKKVTCTDISKHVIETKKFPKVEYVHAPVQHMKAIADASYDLVHVSHVLEHVNEADIERSIKEIGRIMKTGAICFILGSLDTRKFEDFCEKHIGEAFGPDMKSAEKELALFKNYNWKCLFLRKK